MVFEKWNRPKERLLVCLLCIVSDADAGSGYLRSSRDMERILPCASELNEVQSELESFEALSRHRSDPSEHNIFIHHSHMTGFPSEGPSALPTIDSDDDKVISMITPSATPSVVPSVTVSVSSVLPTTTYSPTTTFTPTVTYKPTSTFVPSLRETDVPDFSQITNIPTAVPSSSLDDGFNVTDTPSTFELFDSLEPTFDFSGYLIDEFLALLSTDGSLDIAGSPQNDALMAIINSTLELDPTFSEDRLEILQRYALNTLYFSTNGDSWNNNYLWTSASHPCGSTGNANNTDTVTESQDAWYGVLCDSNKEVVEKLSLESNDLRGILPSEIQGLSGLQSLEISGNKLSGSIPDAMGKLTKLFTFEAGTNFFTGTIPQNIGSLSSLTILDISSNFLSGSLGAEFGRLSLLRGLSVASNFLGGTVPTELFSLSSLISLDLENNDITGSLSSELGQLSNALSLSFSKNMLTGMIPSEISSLANIEIFNANQNYITGKLPDVFDELFYLRSFDMALNFLTGTLPQSLFFNASRLEKLYLSGNTIGNESSIPSEIGEMKSLQMLDLSINQFIGSIPSEIGEMNSLEELHLDTNFLTGQLPTSLTLLTNIEVLSLSGNSLAVLPTGLTALTKLRELQLSSNIFDELPEEYVNDFTELEILNVSKNAIGEDGFPSQFQSTALTTIDFSFNNLNETFNISSLTTLVNLENLHMASCSLRSTLPDDINLLQSLISIDLDSNKFLEGTIPSSLGDISSLRNILLASNQLEGTIPSELAQISDLHILELQSNSLSGTIPTEFVTLTGLEIFNISGNNIAD